MPTLRPNIFKATNIPITVFVCFCHDASWWGMGAKPVVSPGEPPGRHPGVGLLGTGEAESLLLCEST